MTRSRRCYLWLGGLVAALVLGGAVGGRWYSASRPEHRLRRGQEALLQGDVWAADQLAARLEASGHPDHAHLLRGQIYLRQGRLDRAVEEYNQIRREELLAEASLIYGLGFLSLRRWVPAERLLAYVAEVRPDNLDAHRGLAAIYFDRRAMRPALEHLETWSRLDDRDGQPHRMMGLIYLQLASKERAVRHYRAALARALKPEVREEVVFELVETLIQLVSFREALACLDEHPPVTAEGRSAFRELRAEVLLGVGRTAEAVRTLEEARGTGPPSARWLRLRGLAYMEAGEPGAAVEVLQQALQMDKHDCRSRYQLAVACEQLGRRAEAAEHHQLWKDSQQLLQQLTDLSHEALQRPVDAAVRRRLAEVCEALGKPELAQLWLRAAASCPDEGLVKQARALPAGGAHP
jgi:tetratricopeptide (TPR) repeat protein